MKKLNIGLAFGKYSQENLIVFYTLSNLCSTIIKNFITLTTEFELLFREKLPIIYANLRV